MIKIEFSKLKNGNLEITEDMLNGILSYMKRQENYIKQLKQESKRDNKDVLLFGCYGMRGYGKSYYEKLKEKDLKIKRLNNIIDDLVDIIAISLDVNKVEKAFNISFDDFIIWIKEKIKEVDKK